MKCRDCPDVKYQYITGYDGSGMFRFYYCAHDPVDTFFVDPGIERQCQNKKRNTKPTTKPPTYATFSKPPTSRKSTKDDCK
jgi:hypothetical protein